VEQSVELSTVNSVVLWPLLLYFGLVIIVVGGMLAISYVLGERHREKATGEPYESGIVSTGSARLRFDVKFYLTAMFFVIFDLEAAFLFAWVIAFRQLGWSGYAEAVVFVVILLVALIYLWRTGALDWGPRRRRSR
jgi:NADH-quinone oxidoreductase subunit A